MLCCGRYRTLAVVSEQHEPYVVGFYCLPCYRRYGRRRFLAVANSNPATFGGWDIDVARRAGHSPQRRHHAGRNDGGVVHGDVSQLVTKTAPDKRLQLIPIYPLSPAAQLICRRKVPEGERPHRPRLSRAAMVELVEGAKAAGRHDVYV
jgi:hypothetical protein